MQLGSESLTRAAVHERVAAVLVDGGLVLTLCGVVAALVSEAMLVTGIFAIGLTALLLGMGLYLPAYFIGQELFDVGGLSAVVFIYLLGTISALSLAAMVIIAPADVARMVAVVLLISAFGGRTELRRPAPLA